MKKIVWYFLMVVGIYLCFRHKWAFGIPTIFISMAGTTWGMGTTNTDYDYKGKSEYREDEHFVYWNLYNKKK